MFTIKMLGSCTYLHTIWLRQLKQTVRPESLSKHAIYSPTSRGMQKYERTL